MFYEVEKTLAKMVHKIAVFCPLKLSLPVRVQFVVQKVAVQWCLDLVDSDLVDCQDLVDYCCCLTRDRNGQILL